MSTLRVSNIEAKADPSSPSVDEKLKVTNSNGDVLVHIDGKTAGITTVGINTTDSSFTVDAAQNIKFIGIVTATKFSLSGGGEITGGDGNFTGIVTASSLNVTGNVSIGGTLTYEDVTSIDSIGIVTAQSDVHVGAGLSVVGISTLANTNVNGQLTASNSNVTGVSTLGNTIIGTGTTELIVTGNARVTGSLTATNFSGNLTGNVTGNITGESTLSGISSSISDTAVDIFVYDTSKDSDGGAWRKRTQHTSWYNETLGTADRGTRREFPAVAVIVAEGTQLTIYDGDDPDLPMWMVFNLSGAVGVSCNMLPRGGGSQLSDITSVAFLNSKLVVGLKDVDGNVGEGPVEINFISDFGRVYREVGSGYTGAIYDLPISGRNSNSAYNGDYNSLGIVAQTVNDVAMTVLPNAPVDSATGLPVPTIAVATDGGVSVIKDDGTVVDITSASGSNYNQSKAITITEENYLWWLGDYNAGSTYLRDSYAVSLDNFPSSDFTWNNSTDNVSAGTYYALTTNGEAGEIRIGPGNTWAWNHQERNALGGPAGLAVHKPNIGSETNSLIAAITSDYNTGYMHGDCKGAFLSDTDIEDGVELVSNGTFNTNTTGWTVVGGGSATVSSGQAQLTNNGTNNASLDQTVTTVVGKTYEITANITPQGGGPMPRMYVGNKYVQVGSNSNSSQTVTLTYTATSTSTIVSINANTNVNNAITLADNVSMKLTNDIIGSNLIDNGDFGTGNFTNWSTSGTTAPTISSGGALLTTGAADGAIWQSTSGEATSGKWNISWTVTTNSGGFFGLYLGNDGANGSGGSLVKDSITTSGSYYYEGNVTAVEFRHRGASSGIIDNITLIRVGDEDRSVNNQGLQVFGTVTKTPVATGAELVAYSGFSASNVLVQSYNSGLNPGTGNYSFTFWFKCSSTGAEQTYMRRFGVPTVTGGMMMRLVSSSSVLQWYVRDTSSTSTAVNSSTALDDGNWHCAVGTREGSTAKLYIDGRLDTTSGCSANSHDPGTTSSLVIGAEEISSSPGTYQNPADSSSMALMRYSLSAPSAEQVKKMYNDEKHLFVDNAKCTLYGSSDAVTALAFDEVTDQLHVGTSAGRSDFQGLRRINNTTTAVTTAISAHDEFIIEQ